jgi:predicted nuclease of predicted toxin-antitoxin system
MRFFLDENFPAAAFKFLKTLGHEVVCALDHYPPGTDDVTLFDQAQRQKAIFLTTDKDFFHTVPWLHPHRTSPVIAITLDQPNRQRILNRLQAVIASADLASDPEAVYLVTDKRILRRS